MALFSDRFWVAAYRQDATDHLDTQNLNLMGIIGYMLFLLSTPLWTSEIPDVPLQQLEQSEANGAKVAIQGTNEPATIFSFTRALLRDLDCTKTTCDTLVVQRPNRDQRSFLEFPHGGTQTDVYLYELQRFLTVRDDYMELDYAVLRHDGSTINSGQSPILNLTALEDGYYMINYLSCSMASEIRLQLTTEKP